MIVTADDFGLSIAVNRAVETAARDGILTCASLMVGEAAVADAVARARRLPGLRVGLHVVIADGTPVLPPDRIPDLVDSSGRFRLDLFASSVRLFFRPSVRRQLRAEIEAQFAAFAATGLTLDHVNAHKHMHLHPTLASTLFAVGRSYGMKAMRVPLEPALGGGSLVNRMAAALLRPWVRFLGARARRAGLMVNDRLFGLAWTGALDEARVAHLIETLPDGVSELYCHPADERSADLVRLMPGYGHVEEFNALTSPRIRDLIAERNIALIGFGDLSPVS